MRVNRDNFNFLDGLLNDYSVVYAREISPYKRVLVFFITSKLLGVLNAPLMSCHGGIHDLRASK